MTKKQKIREKFRILVLERDNYTCVNCGVQYIKKTGNLLLDAHHIMDRCHFPNGGYVLENGVSVCKVDCHFELEIFHIRKGLEWAWKFHPFQLYDKIDSSLKQAIIADSMVHDS